MGDTRTSLWMGDIDPSYMDDAFIRNVFLALGEQVTVKLIRDRATGGWCNYCFVDFHDNVSAVKALAAYNGTPIPGTNKNFRLNWASGGGGSYMPAPSAIMPSSGIASTMGTLTAAAKLTDPTALTSGPEYSIFIGDLSAEVTEESLLALFQSYYQSVKAVKVVTDPITGLPKGYGFVRFFDETEQQRALNEMQGVYCGSRPMRISTVVTTGGMQTPGGYGNSVFSPEFHLWASDPANTVVTLAGLRGIESNAHLRSLFENDLKVVACILGSDKTTATIQFDTRAAAEQGMEMVHKRLGLFVQATWGRPFRLFVNPFAIESVAEMNAKFVSEQDRLLSQAFSVWSNN